MKKIFIAFISIAILGLFACDNNRNNENDSTSVDNNEIETSLIGAWRNVDEGANYIEFNSESQFVIDIINYRQEAGEWEISNDSLIIKYTINGEVVSQVYYAATIEDDKLTVVSENNKTEVYTKCDYIELPILTDKYNYVDMLVEGMAVVAVENSSLYGYINEKGEEVIIPMYTFADQFNDGEAMVELDGEIFYIDKENNRLD